MLYQLKQLLSVPVRAMGNLPHTTAPLAGVIKVRFGVVQSGVTGGGVTTDPVIQLTVATAEPVVPCVFTKVKVNDPFPVNR